MREIGASLTLPPAGASGMLAVAATTYRPTSLPSASSTVARSASRMSPKSRVTMSIWSLLNSLRLLPRLLRIFCQKVEASMSCTHPLRSSGFLLERIHT